VLSAHLPRRADDPTKHWKYRPGDLDDRALWDDFQRAYGDAIERCSTDAAPWYVVPADRKWYRNWAISRLLCERLEELGLGWPAATFDVEEQKALLGA
jgi:polyphosphate kinase 2 (PPK2 family)